jgi:FG-GAP-like repeat
VTSHPRKSIDKSSEPTGVSTSDTLQGTLLPFDNMPAPSLSTSTGGIYQVNSIDNGTTSTNDILFGGSAASAYPSNLSNSVLSAPGSAQLVASPYLIVPVTAGGITINLEFILADSPTTNFETDVENAAKILAADIHNNITLNIKIGYGEEQGAVLKPGSAEGGPDGGQFESYASVRADLIANAAPGDTNFNFLPTGSSIQGRSQVDVYNAQLKAFGLLAPNDTTTDDGSAGFATNISDSLMVAVALHELTHAMGRVPSGPAPNIFDLTRFTSPGVRLFDGNTPTASAAYFSVDGGNTRLADYGLNSDPSDFLNDNPRNPPFSTLTPEDPFNEFYDVNTIQNLTTVDLTQLDVLGFSSGSIPDDTPTETVPGSVTATQDVSKAISGVSISDADAVSRGETFKVTLSDTFGQLSASNPGGATLSGSGTTNLTISGTVAQVNAALAALAYLSPFFGSESISVATTDNSDGAVTATQFISVTINPPPDDAPTETVPGSVTATQGVSKAISGLSIGDADAVSRGESFKAALTDASGQLSASNSGGATVSRSGTNNLTISGTLAQVNAALATLSYLSAFVGGENVSVTTSDNSDGAVTATQFISVTINPPPDDAPSESVPGSVTVTQRVSKAISGVSIADADAVSRGETFKVTLSDTFGQLSASNSGGAAVSGSGTNNLTIAGTVAQVDAALGTLSYLSAVAGGENISVITTDNSDSATTSAQSISVTINPAKSVPTDFNGDQISDLVFQNNGQPGIWLWNGTALTAAVALPNPGPSWNIVTSRDVDGDGNADLIWQNSNGTPGIWLMNGTTPLAAIGLPDPGPFWHLVGSGDVNGDGRSDLLWQGNDGTLAVWLMNGANLVTAAGLGNPGANWKVVGAADFDGDGREDILLQNTSTGNVMIDLMNGTSIASSVSIGVGDPSWHAVSVGVFNGTPEIAWQNSNGTPAIWLMNGTSLVAAAGLPNPGPAWKVVSLDHFTADGQAGLLFQNTNGAMALWDMNGTNIAAAIGLPYPGAGWQSVNGHPFASS